MENVIPANVLLDKHLRSEHTNLNTKILCKLLLLNSCNTTLFNDYIDVNGLILHAGQVLYVYIFLALVRRSGFACPSVVWEW